MECEMQRNMKPWKLLAVSEKEEEVAFAWIHGKISTRQANMILGFEQYTGRCTGKIAKIMRKLVVEKKISCRKKKV